MACFRLLRPAGRFFFLGTLVTSLVLGPASVLAYDDPTIGNPNLFTFGSIAPSVVRTSGAYTERIPIRIPPAQIATAGRDNRGPTLGNVSGNFDDPRDTANIRAGANAYNSSSRSNTSSIYAAGSNAAYNGSVRDISRILSAISAVAKAFSIK